MLETTSLDKYTMNATCWKIESSENNKPTFATLFILLKEITRLGKACMSRSEMF